MEPENKTKKRIGIAISIIIMLVVLFVTIFNEKKPTETPLAEQNPIPQTKKESVPLIMPPKIVETPPVTDTTPSYTLLQVAAHSNSGSCWTIIRTGVYDLTSWINTHPGGSEAILSICGKDGTMAFENQHGGQRRPENELKTFFIGNYRK